MAHHFRGPEPSLYILWAIAREEKIKFFFFFLGVDILVILCEFGVDILFMIFLAEMITKFNQEIYAKLRARKNKPLTSIGQKQPRVTKEVVETIASTPVHSSSKESSW